MKSEVVSIGEYVSKTAEPSLAQGHQLRRTGKNRSAGFPAEAQGIEQARNNLGCRLLVKAGPQASLAAFEKALALDPQAPLVQTNLGIVHLMLEKADQAEQSPRRGTAVDPTDRKAR